MRTSEIWKWATLATWSLMCRVSCIVLQDCCDLSTTRSMTIAPPSKVPVGFLEHLRDERDICLSTGSRSHSTDMTERIHRNRFEVAVETFRSSNSGAQDSTLAIARGV